MTSDNVVRFSPKNWEALTLLNGNLRFYDQYEGPSQRFNAAREQDKGIYRKLLSRKLDLDD